MWPKFNRYVVDLLLWHARLVFGPKPQAFSVAEKPTTLAGKKKSTAVAV
jgi:hypothetical protein